MTRQSDYNGCVKKVVSGGYQFQNSAPLELFQFISNLILFHQELFFETV